MIEIYYKDLAYVMMDPDKSQDLPGESASWRPTRETKDRKKLMA